MTFISNFYNDELIHKFIKLTQISINEAIIHFFFFC